VPEKNRNFEIGLSIKKQQLILMNYEDSERKKREEKS